MTLNLIDLVFLLEGDIYWKSIDMLMYFLLIWVISLSVTTIIVDIDDPDEEQNKRAHRCYRRLYVFSLSLCLSEIIIHRRRRKTTTNRYFRKEKRKKKEEMFLPKWQQQQSDVRFFSSSIDRFPFWQCFWLSYQAEQLGICIDIW